MLLEPPLHSELRSLQSRLLEERALRPVAELEGYYATFRARFGPERLRGLDGQALLEAMHSRGTHDSLVYWLEFKNDEELPGIFGSISGGSAYKFGFYQKAATGQWLGGNPRAPTELTLEQAIDLARTQRNELLAAVERIAALPLRADDSEYATLQQDIQRAAPNTHHLAWVHKYLALLFPDRLDDYHNASYQRYHLVRLLQVPPGEGLYSVAGRFMSIARELGIHVNHLTTTLNNRNRSPYQYWRIGTRNGQTQQSQWELMRAGGYVAIGWPKLADLTWLLSAPGEGSNKDRLRAALETHYPNAPSAIGNSLRQITAFVVSIQERDLILASDGAETLGIGRVTGDYTYDSSLEFPHLRAVEWLNLEEWQTPVAEGLRTTVAQLGKHPENLIAAERRILGAQPIKSSPRPVTVAKPEPSTAERLVRTLIVPQLEGTAGRIQSILERKGQVIVYGPPGTGKTYWALQVAQDLAAYSAYGLVFGELSPQQVQTVVDGVKGAGYVRMCTFHPAYGYEDFLEGYRPIASGQQLAFERGSGVFKRLCEDAARDPGRRYYLLIDEINRGDIPRIFGELLTVLEKDKRGQGVLLPLSGQLLRVPDNVFVIGTMNTADRSIALLDAALRRRFGFVELLPDPAVLGSTVVGGIPLGPWLAALNQRLVEHLGRDARNLQIGHAYFLERGQPVSDWPRLIRILQDDLIPLLEEYCYEDYAALARILGTGLVDEPRQRIRRDLFEVGSRDDLLRALLAPCPELATSSQVVAASVEAEEQALDDVSGDAADES